MTMDPASIAMLAIATTMLVGLGGVIVSIFATSNATHRRIDDFRTDVDRRFSDVDRRLDDFRMDVDRRFGEVDHRFGEIDRRLGSVERQIGDQATDFRSMRGRIDHIADSLNLGRPRSRKRA